MVDTERILITRTTGNVGSATLDNLGTTDVSLRALIHGESKTQIMKDRVVEAVVGDFLEPDSLAPALEGIRIRSCLLPRFTLSR